MSNSKPFQLNRRGHLSPVIKCLERITGLHRLGRIYEQKMRGTWGVDFVRKALESLKIDYHLNSTSSEGVPASGSLLVVANHPLGGAEGLALMDLLLNRRADVKVLSNQMLGSLPELSDLFIGVDILSRTSEQRKAANQRAVEEACRWLSDGGALIIFPAGEVAGWDWSRGVQKEAEWRHTAGKILRQSKAALLPVFVQGRNSRLFYLLGAIHPLLRTVWLVRQLLNRKDRALRLYLGKVEPASVFKELPEGAPLTNALTMRVFLQAHDASSKEVKKVKKFESNRGVSSDNIASPLPVNSLEADISQLKPEYCLLRRGCYEVWCAEAEYLPHILHEIGRLREVTFRRVGEGSGRSLDLDSFDHDYLHLFVWNREQREMVGAYRLGQVDKIVARRGISGLYTRSLFRYDQHFLDKLGSAEFSAAGCSSALEMGRSFIRPEYQKSLMALQLLWRGVGQWVSAHPRYRTLFGPVSISSEYQELTRYLMASCLERNNSDRELAALVEPQNPVPELTHLLWRPEMLSGLGDIQQLSNLVQLLEHDRDVPVLLKQYLKLNGTFVGFNIDPDFANTLDGLIIVDLIKSKRKSVVRYLSEEGYERLHRYHSAPVARTVGAE